MKKRGAISNMPDVGHIGPSNPGFPTGEAEALLAESKKAIKLKQRQANESEKAYEEDDGPLSEAQWSHLKALADAYPRMGKLTVVSELFPGQNSADADTCLPIKPEAG